MALTVAQLKTEIRAALGGRTDFDARLNIVINMCQDRLARLKDFDELRTIPTIVTAVTGSAANDKIISLSSLGRYRKIYSIRLYASNTRDRKLVKLIPKRWDQIIPKPEYYARGTPSHYMLWGKDQIELWRVPDLVYTMHFRISRWPTAVTADGDFLDLENVDDLIIHLAASYLALSSGNVERSNELYRIYAALAVDALKEEVEDFDTHMAIHGTEIVGNLNRGYDDPFVRSIEVLGD